jgi:hypothetical protein
MTTIVKPGLTRELAGIGQVAARIVRACGWSQGLPLTDVDDQPEDHQRTVSLSEALRCAETTAGDGLIAAEVFTAGGHGDRFNDEATTTQSDVENALTHGRITERDLEVVLGPAWAEVIAFVRRVAVLTSTQAERLSRLDRQRNEHVCRLRAAGRSEYKHSHHLHELAHAAAGEPEHGPSWTASRLGRAAATYAGHGAPGMAVTDAAIGLATRHAVGRGSYPHGLDYQPYTRGHYDQLTLTWRLAIGSLHPADPPLTTQPG